MKIAEIRAREILDSRGMPTVEACVRLENGGCGRAAVPSGASTGAHEALEKRDGDERYGGRGVRFAVQAVNGPIREALTGMRADVQDALDRRLLALDGTGSKAALGANAMLAVSMAAARAAAQAHGLSLWRYLGGIAGGGCPRLMMNVLNGGRHAGNNVDIQEFMLVSSGALPAAEAVRMGAEIDQALKKCLQSRGMSVSVGDEGGFAPDLASDEEALELLMEAAGKAGYEPGQDVGFALDMAASGWVKGSIYHLPKRGTDMTREELIDYICALTERYPIVSVEDPLGEDDFEGFALLTEALNGRCLVVGDDLFVTDRARIERGAALHAATAALIKPNQIGTLTETLDAIHAAHAHGMKVIVSHRSGETTDDFIADLAVAVHAEGLKAGAPVRGERVAKYNRLMEIASGARSGRAHEDPVP